VVVWHLSRQPRDGFTAGNRQRLDSNREEKMKRLTVRNGLRKLAGRTGGSDVGRRPSEGASVL
jgi:hypothetical protein